jgi:pimeloyl-ACP methyl ester carboxylesterase
MQTRKYLCDGRTLEADLCGEGGRKILLLHGIPGSRRVWASVSQHLATEHTVLSPDLLGFGGSDVVHDINSLWIEGQGRALLGLLEQLGWQRFSVVGHDYGGPVAMGLHALAGDRFETVTLVSTNMFPDTVVPAPLSGIFLPLIGRGIAKLLFSRASLGMMVRSGMRRRKPASLGHYLGPKTQSVAIATIFETALREMEERYAPVLNEWRKVHVPRVVVWGDSDPFFSVEVGRRTSNENGAMFRLLSRAGHFLPEECPEDLSEAVLSLLRTI